MQYVGHKFPDAMTYVMYDTVLNGGSDESAGDVQFGLHADRIGRRVLTEDLLGFCELIKFDTVDEARVFIGEVATNYEEDYE